MNKPIRSHEIETVIKNLRENKSPGPNCVTDKFYEAFREELTFTLLKLFQNTAERKTPKLFCEATTTLIPKLDKDVIKKENYKLIEAKILNKIIANRIQQYIKRIIHHDQVGFTPGMQRFFNARKSINVIYHTNKLKDKNHMTISIDAEKVSDKIKHLFMKKNFPESRPKQNEPTST